MTTAAKRKQIINWISKLDDAGMIEYLEDLSKRKGGELSLTSSQISEINLGLEEIERGETEPHSKVWNEHISYAKNGMVQKQLFRPPF